MVKAENFIFIYGEVDPYTSASVQLIGKTNSLKFVKEGGSHTTRIQSLKKSDQERIFKTLEEWLGIPVNFTFGD